MDAFSMYTLPIQGLKLGIHKFTYQLDKEFYDLFDDSPISVSEIDALLIFDRRPSMLVLTFEFRGKAEADCDRCLAPIFVPLEGTYQLHVKFSEESRAGDDNDEVIFISPKLSEFNVAPYLYEFSVVSLPFSNTIDCDDIEENPPCNFETLSAFGDVEEEVQPEERKSVWDALKDLGLDDNLETS